MLNNPRDPLWTKRVQVLSGGQAQWLTLPLKRPEEGVFLPINQMTLAEETPFKDKHLRTLRHAYERAPFFELVYPLITAFYEDDSPLIALRNQRFIESVSTALGFTPRFVCASDLLQDDTLKATPMLVALIEAVGGKTYLCGGGSSGYQEDALFEAAGIAVQYQSFEHPQYPQLHLSNANTDFIKGLSILDALMHCGFEGTAALLQTTPRPTKFELKATTTYA